MGSQVVFCGPSTAGKTTLMLNAAGMQGELEFTIDRTWTTRPIRPGEDDLENVFVESDEFENQDYLMRFQNHPTYVYGITDQPELAENEIRMRILPPLLAVSFREIVEQPVIICSVLPFLDTPEEILRERDPEIDAADLVQRKKRFYSDQIEAKEVYDLQFQNVNGIQCATTSLVRLLTDYYKNNQGLRTA